MFASHEELAKVAIAKIQRVCGFVIDKNGKIGKFEEKERESLVDPAEWYEELKRAGHPEVELVKTAPVKIRICQQDGEELNTAQDQTQSINNIGDIFITNVDEEGHPLEHEYPFGDKEKKTPQERVKEFYDTYYEDHNKPGFYRKKGIIRGIQVSETRRMSAKWSPNGAELKAGGYLIMKADNDYYPINPDSLTSYRVVTDLREEE
jgi:hypothetical protein